MRNAIRAAIATVAFGVVHSLLASRRAKHVAEVRVGPRHRNGLYRVFYNAQAVASFAMLTLYIRSLPREELYRVDGAAAGLMRAGQAAGLVWGYLAARSVGILPLSGLQNAATWARGGDPDPEPEAQGPRLAEDGTMKSDGPFRHSRHPLNFSPIPVLWLQPVMTTRLAGFTAMATVYLMLGSRHEESRLKIAYGDAYDAYLHTGVPFYFPSMGDETNRRLAVIDTAAKE